MDQDESHPLSDADKANIASAFLLLAPPGEFNEVLSDVRDLLGNDDILTGASTAFSQYNKEQMTPVNIQDFHLPVLITEYNDLGGGRFGDPRYRHSFNFDHIRKEASEVKPWEPDTSKEALRSAVEAEVTEYCNQHYAKGASLTISKKAYEGQIIICCIEAHDYQPHNSCNGLWRSEWRLKVSEGQAEVIGDMKIQVHYFEEGNVQLVSSKDVKETITMGPEKEVARELVKVIERAEKMYQTGVTENYQTMTDTTFKTLRRALPVTRTKFDWNRVTSYTIGKELKG